MGKSGATTAGRTATASCASNKGLWPVIQGLASSFVVLGALFTGVCCLLLPMRNAVLLRWYEEMSFFAPDMFNLLVSHPGGLIDYAGAFLTQFLFYPWLGTAILLTFWLLTAYVISKAFRISGGLLPWAFVPVYCLLVSALSFDEAWISLKSYGSMYTPAIGTLVASLMIWGYRSLSANGLAVRSVALVAFSAMYPFLGFYAVLAVAVCACGDLADMCRGGGRGRIVSAVIGMIAVLVIPYVYYYTWPGSIVDNENLYLKGLPGFRLDTFDRYMWMPFVVMSMVFVVYSLVNWRALKSKKLQVAGLAVVLCFCGFSFHFAGSVSRQLRATVSMLRYVDHNQWEHVGYVMEHSRCEPDIYMVVYDRIARLKLGLPMNEIEVQKVDTDPGNPRKADELLGSVFMSVPANYHLGKINSAYRNAMEFTVAFGERVYYMKYMVRTALCNGEYELAEKYNNRLMGTLFHRYWAEHYKRYIDNPELMKESAEFNSIPPYEPDEVFVRPVG